MELNNKITIKKALQKDPDLAYDIHHGKEEDLASALSKLAEITNLHPNFLTTNVSELKRMTFPD